MKRALYLKFLSCMMAVIFPAALFSADQPGAMVYTHGTALLNGNSVARSSAIFSGDLVQTNADSAANINASGSIVLILNDSLVQYEGSRSSWSTEASPYRPRNRWRLELATSPCHRPLVFGPNLKSETWMVRSRSRRERVT